ncbi:MAG: DUF11 domain-containing protein [Bacteroidota bacterium]
MKKYRPHFNFERVGDLLSRKGGLRTMFFAGLLMSSIVSLSGQVSPNFVNVDTYSGNSNDVTVNMPPGSVPGDVVVAYIVQDDDDANIVDESSAFVQLYNLPGSTNGPRTGLFYRVIDGTEAASYVFDLSNEPSVVTTLRYQNLDPVTPFLADDEALGNSTTPTAPSVTTTRDDVTYLQFIGIDGASDGVLAATSGTATVEAASESGSGGGQVEMMIVSEVQATSGTTPLGGFTFGIAYPWTGITLALNAYSIETTTTTGTLCPVGTASFSVAYEFGSSSGTLELLDPLGNVLTTENYNTAMGTATLTFTPTATGTYTVRDQAVTTLATTAVFTVDTDGDSVCDDVDMDDDNDGITDAVEDGYCNLDYNLPANKSLIQITTNTGVSGAISTLLDGVTASNDLFFTNTGWTGDEIVRLEFPLPSILTGLEFWIRGNRMMDNGTTLRAQGSNDGNSWEEMVPVAEYVQSAPDNTPGVLSAAAQAHTFLWTNATSYKYYRVLGISGGGNTNPWVDELFFRTDAPTICDFDGDGIRNSADLDSDGDGIPDNVEGQTTAGYNAPNTDNNTTYANNDGINSAYLGGLPLPDIDADGIVDFLDTDADGDRIDDSEESGLPVTGMAAPNGLDVGVSTSNDYSDVNGTVDDPATDLAKVTTTDPNEADYRDKKPPTIVKVCYNNPQYGINGTNKTFADDKLLNLNNWGPDGTDNRYQFELFSFGTGAITETALIANGCQIFYVGGNENPDAGNFNPNTNGTLSGTDKEALRDWGASPNNVLIAFQGYAVFFGGTGYTASSGSPNPNTLTPLGELVISGLFGQTPSFNQAGSTRGRFTAFPPSACVLTEDNNGNPTGLLNGETGDFYFSDYDLLSELMGGLTNNNGISSVRDVFFANLFSSAAQVAIEGPGNICSFFFCPAGDVAPSLTNSSVSSNGQPVDLNPFYTGTPPTGTTLTWHNASPPADENYIGNSTSYTESGVVYAAFRADDGSCYSPATPFMVTVNYPDLAVTISPAMATSALSEVQTFTVTVTNNGPIPAPDAEVKVDIPTNRELILADPSAGAYSSSTQLWEVGLLNSGQSATLEITIRLQ